MYVYTSITHNHSCSLSLFFSLSLDFPNIFVLVIFLFGFVFAMLTLVSIGFVTSSLYGTKKPLFRLFPLTSNVGVVSCFYSSSSSSSSSSSCQIFVLFVFQVNETSQDNSKMTSPCQ